MSRRVVRVAPARNTALDGMIARHAAANGLPVELVHRVVIRESRYNPRARNGGNLGLMQIKHATARGVGYTGPASGLFDAETNLTYAVRYLAGAYRAAGGNQSRAVAYYASGYHGRGVARAPVVTAQASPWGAQMQAAPVAMRDTDMIVYAPQSRVRRR
jgi:soluble lytic murein transglycosylase-like protein